MDNQIDANAEFEAIKNIHDALSPLGDEARTRVLLYIASLLGIATNSIKQTAKPAGFAGDEKDAESDGEREDEQAGETQFSTFAELYDAASPKTNAEKALLAGYWLQVCKGGQNFTANPANKELAHLGHQLSHITDDFTSLKSSKPALVLQLKKSGSTKQAKKTYKLTQAGINKVLGMIGG